MLSLQLLYNVLKKARDPGLFRARKRAVAAKTELNLKIPLRALARSACVP